MKRIAQGENGTGTVFALGILLISLIFTGIAIDFNKAMSKRTHMQVAAEAAAHAALVTRELHSVGAAKSKALEIAATNLPQGRNGDAIQSADIEFGVWDPENGVFTVDSSEREAVRVYAHRTAERGNSVRNILLDLIGFDTFDLSRAVIFESYIPSCLREGFVAEDRIEIQSGNLFKEGYCLHSNTHVALSSGNTFEKNVIVSMPDIADLVTPSGGFGDNDGLEPALRENGYHINILDRITDIALGVSNPTSPHFRDYLTPGAEPLSVNPNGVLDASDFTPGRLHGLYCASHGQQATIAHDTLLSGVAIVTNCKLHFGEGIALENATIVSLNATAAAIGGASGIRLGRDDNCADGGDAQIATLGSIDFPSNMQLYGGQMIAQGDISFSANAYGVQGASVIAGGRIDGTSNMQMGFCDGAGMGNNYEAQYFRMAQYSETSPLIYSP
ncbi:TadG family pilus assembly protein [Aliisedimentitalea sp. MJ-SS2]|uniref:pilus assembly protein TadG-related protein n=1 Tax=Aliisedimentitalea sp. MJ-SS2 TaxID=3049795 RepID=UPI00292DE002|nr:TadG family pilus assembly protein [Alisedimentitalea sp. MJ-SS2]